MLLGMLALRRQPVRQPQLRLYAGKKRRRHALAAGGGDDEGGGCRTAERPLPPGLALHARARLVAGDRLAGAHLLRDPLGRLSDCLADAGEHVGDDTLRDGEAEQSLADLGQPLVADHLAAVQVRDDRRDAQRATWPNGVPSGMSAGALAVTRALQHGHVARSSSMPVVIGLIGGRRAVNGLSAGTVPVRPSFSRAARYSSTDFAGFFRLCRCDHAPRPARAPARVRLVAARIHRDEAPRCRMAPVPRLGNA
jgi:hypothetical protein